MELSDVLNSVASIIYGEGDQVPGCQLSVEEAKAWLSALEPRRPFCLIADWCWLDLDLPLASRALSDQQTPPALVYGGNVLFDSRHRFPIGGWVRSTMLVALRDEFIFETRNTRYVLMGPGARRTSSTSAVASIR
ncbi:DUF6957 family protein [Pseudomonas aeruginosa]|uniref:DUF6957 family protein n=1 Tax=Pseudomonas aeruginosa TaxID=287 RepID=UPI001F4AB7B2|nr:hypothetical protein [Pseudomonas aeruginosa]